MRPPGEVCRALYRIHPQLRLAWDGTNGGAFALVQLYHLKDCGTPDEPLRMLEFWNVIPILEAGSLVNKRAERGPVYNRYGGTSPDWDPAFRFPLYVLRLDESCEYPWTDVGTQVGTFDAPAKYAGPQDVFSGKFLEAVKYWLQPFSKIERKSREQAYRDVTSRNESMAHEYGPALQAYADYARDRTQTISETVAAEKRIERKQRRNSLAARYGVSL